MAAQPSTRASDADRDLAAVLLRDNLVAGRLSVDEFSDRLDKALTARTLGELADLKSDLPGIDLVETGSSQVETARGGLSPSWRAAWGSWLTISVFALVVWVTGAGGSQWFLLALLLPGVLLLGRWLTAAPAARDRRRDRRGFGDRASLGSGTEHR